jgi:hypothetical protein
MFQHRNGIKHIKFIVYLGHLNKTSALTNPTQIQYVKISCMIDRDKGRSLIEQIFYTFGAQNLERGKLLFGIIGKNVWR